MPGFTLSPGGEFVAHIAGTVTVTAKTSNGKQVSTLITVLDTPLPATPDHRTFVRESSTRDPINVHPLHTGHASLQLNARPSSRHDKLAASTERAPRFVNTSYSPSAEKSFAKVSANKTAASVLLPPLDDPNGWNTDNHGSISDPDNDIGDPPGGAQAGGAGSGNFQMAAPVIALPGRGLIVTLALAYNGRLWSKSGNDITYDIDLAGPDRVGT
jgi:hypothetical protein